MAKLDAALRAVCPIHGLSIGREGSKATWRIDFKDEATPQQRIAAQAVIDAFDVAVHNAEQHRAELNVHILAEIAANDLKIIRAIVDGDTARIDAHKVAQAALRARLA